MHNIETPDTIIIGAGLAGLVAALDLATRGRRVTVLERSRHIGGRARSNIVEGHTFNLGPHALYRNAPLERTLTELNVPFQSNKVTARGYFVDGEQLHTAITGPVSMFATGALDVSGKLEMARFLATLKSIDAKALATSSTTDFITETFRSPSARRVALALTRLTTYSNDPDRLSAEVFVQQMRAATFDGVGYVDGGWQSIVEGLRTRAEACGVQIETGVGATRVALASRGVLVNTDAGPRRAGTAIIAGPPRIAAALTSAPSLLEVAETASPVLAATLDVALAKLPAPRATFGLGIDAPTYFSVHSAVADLAPEAGATIHLARYGVAQNAERTLDTMLDRLQPHWRDHLVHRRFLPKLVVACNTPTAATGGLAGRPDVEVVGMPGVFVAGDWVGPEGLLADAAVASARRAAQSTLARAARSAA